MKKINLYKQYLNTNQKKTRFTFVHWSSIYLISLVLIVGFAYMKEAVKNSALKNKYTQLQAYVDDETNINNYTKSLTLQSQLADREIYIGKIEQVNDILKTKGRLSASILNSVDLALPKGVKVNSVTMNQGVVVVSYSSKTELGPSLFARNLSNDKTFLAIDYPGFTRIEARYETKDEEEVLVSEEHFSGTINLTLNGGY